MSDEFELGYTPANLKKIREQYRLTQTDVAQICGMSHRVAVGRWETALDKSGHASMPHEKWVMFLNYIKNCDKI